MAKKKQEQKNVVTGRNIYIDKQGRTVYYKKSKQQGFVIRPGSETQFKAYYNRFLVGFVAIIFFDLLLLNNLILSIPLGVAIYLFMEFKWRKLLNSYTMIQNFEPGKQQSSFNYIINLDTQQLVLRIILYTALAICLVLNIYTSPNIENNLLLTIGSYILAVLAIYMAGRLVYAITKKKQK